MLDMMARQVPIHGPIAIFPGEAGSADLNTCLGYSLQFGHRLVDLATLTPEAPDEHAMAELIDALEREGYFHLNLIRDATSAHQDARKGFINRLLDPPPAL